MDLKKGGGKKGKRKKGKKNQTGHCAPSPMSYYFPYVFTRWYWYFSNNQVITRFLSDLHLLLRRKHLQLAPTKEHNRRRIYNPLPPQQNTETFTSRPAGDGVSLAGADVTALGHAATRGRAGQLSWVRTSALNVQPLPTEPALWSCL